MSLALALLLIPQTAEPVHAFVEVVAQSTTIFVEQPVRLTIRFGVEKEYLRHNLLQLFTRPLDVPVQLELPWPAETVDVAMLGPTFALGEEIVRPTRSREEQRSGATWVVLELERAFVPETPGRLELPGPILHFAFATRFEQDQVNGNVPIDRQMADVRGAGLALEVLPLPAEGRPAGFVDALGKFALSARAEPLELEPGGALKLVLEIEGQGNLGKLAPPRLDALAGWHLQGRTDELHGSRRTLACDLVPDSPRTREIPAITLEYFDPDARAYRRASTAPIPISIKTRATPGATIDTRPTLYVLLGLVVLAAIAIVRLVRRKRS